MLESSDRATNPNRYWSLLRKLGGKRSNPPPNISIAFDGKTHSSLKAISWAFNRQFTACSAQQDRAIRRLLRNLHRQHQVDPSYTANTKWIPLTAAIRKAGSSTAQEPDGFTMLHLRHLGAHGLAFMTNLFNLSVAEIDIPAIWKRAGPLLPPHLTALPSSEDTRAAHPPHPSWWHWVLAPPSMAPNRGTPTPRPCCLSLLGWSLALTNVSPLAEL